MTEDNRWLSTGVVLAHKYTAWRKRCSIGYMRSNRTAVPSSSTKIYALGILSWWLTSEDHSHCVMQRSMSCFYRWGVPNYDSNLDAQNYTTGNELEANSAKLCWPIIQIRYHWALWPDLASFKISERKAIPCLSAVRWKRATERISHVMRCQNNSAK